MSDERSGASWSIQPHTEAKHAILSAYLRAWFPILSLSGFERVIYIDGFAGPGRYLGGQDGSPILALKALAGQSLPLRSVFEFHFVELDQRISDVLSANIAEFRAQGMIGPGAEIHVHARCTFEEAYDRVIGPRLAEHPRAPAFALVDPFGWTGIPMRILSELLRRDSTEVFVNFMFEEINRFLAHEDQPRNFDALFGASDWREALELTGAERKRYLHDFYRNQLQLSGGARYVRSFEMRNDRGLVDYFLFFATSNLKGLSKMKEAMWRVDPAGAFMFSDTTDPNQSMLFQPEPDRHLLRRLIERKFSGQRVQVGDVERFVVRDTPFLATHYKRVLSQMEAAGQLTVIDAPAKRRAGTFPDLRLMLAFGNERPALGC